MKQHPDYFNLIIKKLLASQKDLRFVLISFVIGFISCTKDNKQVNANPAILSGNWSFTGTHGNTQNVLTETRNGAYLENDGVQKYTSTSNTGTVNFSGDVMSFDSVAYDFTAITTIQIITSSYNGSSTDTLNEHEFYAHSSSEFEIIGQDSIHFLSPGFPGSGGWDTPPTDGVKFSISGNTLTLTSHIAHNNTDAFSSNVGSGTIVTTLVKR